MPTDSVIVVSDAHLGSAMDSSAAFHRFLDAVPDLASHLVINGDLFDFWFEYHTVIPRRAFPVLSALHQVRRRGTRLTITGGNHDRWGGDFWREELDATFYPDGAVLTLAGWKAYLAHGDGLAEHQRTAKVMHRITRWPVTATAFRWLHPDVGYPLVRAMSGGLANTTRDRPTLDRSAEAQARYAREFLVDHGEIDLIVLGHTHRPALESVGERRWYLNPGAWMDGQRYAVIGAEGPELRSFSEAA